MSAYMSGEWAARQPVAVAMFLLGTPYGTDIEHVFVATGATRQEAVNNLMDGWRIHCDQTGMDHDLLHDEDAMVVEGPLGSSFRDGQPLNWI